MLKPNKVNPEKFRASLQDLLAKHEIEGYEVAEVLLQRTARAASVNTPLSEESGKCWRFRQVAPGRYEWVLENC